MLRSHRIGDSQADSWNERLTTNVISMTSLYLDCWQQLSRTWLRLIFFKLSRLFFITFSANIYWSFFLYLIVSYWISTYASPLLLILINAIHFVFVQLFSFMLNSPVRIHSCCFLNSPCIPFLGRCFISLINFSPADVFLHPSQLFSLLGNIHKAAKIIFLYFFLQVCVCLVQATITKYCRLGALNKKLWFLLAYLSFLWGLSSGLQTADFSLYPLHGGKKARELFKSFL